VSSQPKQHLDALQRASEKLQSQGDQELANELLDIAQKLRSGVPEPPDGLVTTGEAAKLLGIRSVNTIKRWVRDGLLLGFQRGGRILVSRSSVDAILASPPVANQQAYERDLHEAMEPFDAGDDIAVPPTHWPGKKPWEREDARTRSH
jgi:excisionase family DNA binding protein